VRAATGEYMMELTGAIFDVSEAVDFQPGEPPRITSVTPNPGAPYIGEAITIAISDAVDPDTLFPEFVRVEPDGREVAIAFSYQLVQRYLCTGEVEARLIVAPGNAPAPGGVTRLRLNGVLGFTGDATPDNGLTGPFPQPGGAGYTADFRSP